MIETNKSPSPDKPEEALAAVVTLRRWAENSLHRLAQSVEVRRDAIFGKDIFALDPLGGRRQHHM